MAKRTQRGASELPEKIITIETDLALMELTSKGARIKKFYLKNANVIEQLAKINTLIFDKTGTITTNQETKINYEGLELTKDEESLLKSTLRGSNHPLSRTLYQILDEHDILTLDAYEEYLGKGIEASYKNENIKIGSAPFVGQTQETNTLNTSVYVSTNNTYKGKFTFYNAYRKGLAQLFNKLKKEIFFNLLFFR